MARNSEGLTIGPCELLLRVGPTVVTRADSWPPGEGEGKGRGRGDATHRFSEVFPLGAVFTLDAVAAMFSRTSNAVRQLAFQHARELDPPRYWQPRGRGDFKYYRVLSARDVEVLRCTLFRLVGHRPQDVKKKARPVSP